MVKTPDSNSSTEEINLAELLLKIIFTLRSNFWLILLLFLLGLSFGVTNFLRSKKQYESKMIISSNILTTSYAKILFDNANGHLLDEDYELLAKDLQTDNETPKQIASLRIENLTKTEGNALMESDRYLITARVYDQKILPALQKGILNYLETNDFVKIRVEQQRATLTRMLAAIDKELADLQQMKEDIQSGKFFNSAKGNVMFDPTTVNTKILELTQKHIEEENTLQLINSVQLIEGFSSFKHHVQPSFIVSIISGSFIGLLVAGSFIVFKAIRKLVRKAEANNAKNAA